MNIIIFKIILYIFTVMNDDFSIILFLFFL